VRARARGLTPLVALLLASCGGEGESVRVYLEARLGPEGPPGQRSTVLTPVERRPRPSLSPERQAVLELLVGPSPDERARGFRDTIPRGTRLTGLRVEGTTAVVELAGAEPDFTAAAAIVYSLTELSAVRDVRLRLEGAPCCISTHDGEVIPAVSRANFAYWSGEPCVLRTSPTHVRCRRTD